MRFLFDFFPVLLFFVAYKTYDIFVATATAIVASVVQVAVFWLRHRRFETMHLVTLGLITVLGGATLLLRDPEFIMWKVTAINWLFGAVFIGSQFIGHKPIVRRMMEKNVDLPDVVWPRLNIMWAAFFFFIGTVNIWFAWQAVKARDAFITMAGLEPGTAITDFTCRADFSAAVAVLCENAQRFENTWVNFKLFGVIGLTFAFVFAQALYLSRHIQENGNETPE